MNLAPLPDLTRRVETERFGPFVFQLGLDLDGLQMPLQRVEDAHARFIASPLAQVANRLEREVIVSSVFGTKKTGDRPRFPAALGKNNRVSPFSRASKHAFQSALHQW